MAIACSWLLSNSRILRLKHRGEAEEQKSSDVFLAEQPTLVQPRNTPLFATPPRELNTFRPRPGPPRPGPSPGPSPTPKPTMVRAVEGNARARCTRVKCGTWPTFRQPHGPYPCPGHCLAEVRPLRPSPPPCTVCPCGTDPGARVRILPDRVWGAGTSLRHQQGRRRAAVRARAQSMPQPRRVVRDVDHLLLPRAPPRQPPRQPPHQPFHQRCRPRKRPKCRAVGNAHAHPHPCARAGNRDNWHVHTVAQAASVAGMECTARKAAQNTQWI